MMVCNDKDGNQWTTSHDTMEKLILLGVGIKQVVAVLPKELWKLLPRQMPYYVIS